MLGQNILHRACVLHMTWNFLFLTKFHWLEMTIVIFQFAKGVQFSSFYSYSFLLWEELINGQYKVWTLKAKPAVLVPLQWKRTCSEIYLLHNLCSKYLKNSWVSLVLVKLPAKGLQHSRNLKKSLEIGKFGF